MDEMPLQPTDIIRSQHWVFGKDIIIHSNFITQSESCHSFLTFPEAMGRLMELASTHETHLMKTSIISQFKLQQVSQDV